MAEKRRFKRIPVYIRIKEIDQNPKGEGNLLNISAFGAQVETPIRYRAGDLIKFIYIPPSPSLSDLENENKGNAIWNIPKGIVEERLIKGRVIWVAPHPNKENHFLVGLTYSTKKNQQLRIISRIILLIGVAIGVLIVMTNRYVIHDRAISLVEWCSSLFYTMLNDLFYWVPL